MAKVSYLLTSFFLLILAGIVGCKSGLLSTSGGGAANFRFPVLQYGTGYDGSQIINSNTTPSTTYIDRVGNFRSYGASFRISSVDLTKKIMGETSTLNYLVIGAGEMASTLCKHLVKTKPRSLTVISPDGSTAKRLCAELNFGVGMTLLDLQSELSFADCVITATRSQEFLVNRELAENVCSTRRGRPLMFVDISLPRNIDPQISKVADAYVFDIDDLKQIVDVNYRARESALDQASAIISEGVKAFMSRQKVAVIFPVFEQLNSYFSRLMVKEFDRTFSKNIFAELSEDQKEAIANLKTSITTKLTADFSQNMKRDSHDLPALIIFLQSLFDNAVLKDK